MLTLVDTLGENLEVEKEKLVEIPYFESLISVKNKMKTNVDDNLIALDSDLSVEIVKIALRYVEEGSDVLNLLVSLPMTFESSKIGKLVTAIDFLGLEIDITTEDTHKRLTDVHQGGDRWNPEYPDKNLARETAACIVFGLHLDKFELVIPKEKAAMYNHIFFIVSHPATFGPRLRRRAHEAAKLFLNFSVKQWKQIDDWFNKLADSEDEANTDDYESEPDYERQYVGSDDDYGYGGYNSD